MQHVTVNKGVVVDKVMGSTLQSVVLLQRAISVSYIVQPYRAQYFKVRGPIWSGPGASAFPNLASFGRNI